MNRLTFEIYVKDSTSPEFRDLLRESLWETVDTLCVETHSQEDCPFDLIGSHWDNGDSDD